MTSYSRAALALAFAAPAVLTALAGAAQTDDVVEWDGLSHLGRLDRTPAVPVNGEGFDVRFQAFAGDLTSAAVLWDDGQASG
ncbi:MAG: hypothetical protein AAGA55_06415, partial [Planctomycetota bacterium]